MKLNRSHVLLAGVAVALVVAGLWYWRTNQGALEPGAIDLIELFPDAEKRTTMSSLEDGYAIVAVTIDGDRKESIFAHPSSRITWRLTVPGGAVLRTAAALKPEVWASPGDGALFRVGVSDGKEYRDLFRQSVRPQLEPGDRRWFPVEIDLSPWAGQQVDLIFNTEPGPGGNAVSDACVWGAPRIVPDAVTH